MEQDPHGVRHELKSPGWKDPVGHFGDFDLRLQHSSDCFDAPSDARWPQENWKWRVLYATLPAFHLSHAASLLICQGMSPQKLFEGAVFPWNEGGMPKKRIYLRGDLAQPNTPPPRFENVVIAEVFRHPEVSIEETLAFLLKHIDDK